jgi:hypothetical protein
MTSVLTTFRYRICWKVNSKKIKMDGRSLGFKEKSFNFYVNLTDNRVSASGNEVSGCMNVQHLFLGMCVLCVLLTDIVIWRSK